MHKDIPKADMRRHINIRHQGSVRFCPVCNKRFVLSSNSYDIEAVEAELSKEKSLEYLIHLIKCLCKV